MAAKTLEAATARLGEASICCNAQLAPGRIASTIVNEANTWNADMIVLGTHGRRGVRRVLMGRVSEGVLAQTTKPVLLVRSEIEG
jgi:nucleotide-binding universal stress UspA family protein